MIDMTLAQAASLLGVQSDDDQTRFQGLSINTRTLIPGNLFIAFKGERVDGHDFVDQAKAKGAVAALVSKKVACDLPQLLVPDVAHALGILGANWRKQFDIPVIAVTGSNGKTTLKNMIAAIMLAACDNDATAVLATQGTLNNHLGLPLTLARLSKQHRFAVIEMGMNHPGEIAYLTKLTSPSVAIITNAAHAHLEGVGSVEGVARAKAEIFSGLIATGTAILNRDDAFYPYWRTEIGKHDFLTFGFHPDADIHTIIDDARTENTFLTPKGELSVNMPLLGTHNILNALAATAGALAIQIPLTAIKQGLEKNQAAPGRLQLHKLPNGVNIIDDTYNANPFSLQAAIKTLSDFTGKKILVLGDMKELGTEAKSLHQQAGNNIRQAGIDYLFTYGELSELSAQTFGEGGYHFSEQEKLLTALLPLLYNTTTILIKGSRSMQMEKVVQGLMNHPN